jgi:Zn-dependent peptidase ImmA (M78 family)
MEKNSSFRYIVQQEPNVYSDFEHAKGLIVERARQLLVQLFEKGYCEKPPFVPEELSHLLDIQKIVKTDLGETSAMLLKSYNGFIIKLNQYHNEARRNFSFAHEIGHILFSELNLNKYIQSTEYSTFNPQRERNNRALLKERLCDIAATELLMPEVIFKEYLLNYGISVNSIEILAKTFRVSRQATAIRIAEVSPVPCLALLWKPLTKINRLWLRLAWRVCQKINSRNSVNYMPKYKEVEPPSNLHKAYQSNNSTKYPRDFKINNTIKSLPVESKGFGYGKNRYVISLAFLNDKEG